MIKTKYCILSASGNGCCQMRGIFYESPKKLHGAMPVLVEDFLQDITICKGKAAVINGAVLFFAGCLHATRGEHTAFIYQRAMIYC